MSERVLVVAPHADDESLGCGGSIARHLDAGDRVDVVVMTGPGAETPNPIGPASLWERVRAEAGAAMRALGGAGIEFRELPAVRVADIASHIVNRECFEVLDRYRPSILYVPFPFDLHDDHRRLFHAFSVAWRTTSAAGAGVRRVLAYETVSETHWNAPYLEAGFVPHVWADISRQIERKVEALTCYESQMNPFPHARSIEAVRSLAKWRGSQVSVAAAEAFVLIRELA